MPCNPFAPDFLDCLAQESASNIKKTVAKAIIDGALVVLSNSRIAINQNETNIADLPQNVRSVVIEMRNEGMFTWSEQELQEWLDNQP